MSKTPAEKWKEAVTGYRKHCQKILGVSENVRYAGTVNAYGRTLAGVIRPNLKPLLSSKDFKNELFVTTTLVSLRRDFVEAAIGGLEHAVLQHQKITVVVLDENDVTYYISIDRKEKDVEGVVSLIKKILRPE